MSAGIWSKSGSCAHLNMSLEGFVFVVYALIVGTLSTSKWYFCTKQTDFTIYFSNSTLLLFLL